jgi:hypothetical protein
MTPLGGRADVGVYATSAEGLNRRGGKPRRVCATQTRTGSNLLAGSILRGRQRAVVSEESQSRKIFRWALVTREDFGVAALALLFVIAVTYQVILRAQNPKPFPRKRAEGWRAERSR